MEKLTLIERVCKKYKFNEINPICIKGYSGDIILRRYEIVINNNNVYVTRVLLSEMHEDNKTIPDDFRVTVFDGEDDFPIEGISLFSFRDEQRLFQFLGTLL